MSLKTLLTSSLWLASALLPAAATALEDDVNQPVRIQAQSAILDSKNGTSTYRGNVKVTQGSIVVTGERVIVSTIKKRLGKVVADGEPATFGQTTADGRRIEAQASHMEFLSTDNKILLKGNAAVNQAGNSFVSECIEYDIAHEIMEAGGANCGPVQMTIIPENTAAQ